MVTLLPEPDSPSNATTSPGFTDRLTPLTAFTALPPRRKVTERLRISIIASSVMSGLHECGRAAVAGAGHGHQAGCGLLVGKTGQRRHHLAANRLRKSPTGIGPPT